MNLETRKLLRESLTKISTEIAAALRVQLLAPGAAQARARRLHAEEKVGDAFELWTDLLSRRAAVLWVLKSLYVRALEDRGLLRPGRILDAESQQLFAHLAPNLGDTAYLRWVFRDLSTGQGGLPELFALQPAEIATVPDALSRKLIDLWRSRDPDTGVVRYRFDDEHFDGRLLGDLYQDLDPVVKKRYALLQTPDFVLDFILDETLTPAIAEFGLETVRVLDPACGSGHFLLAAFKRLVAEMREKEPQRDVRDIVKHALDRVVGIDLNDYACGLARARLVMTALELCDERDLAAAHDFHPRVYCADALEQVEIDEQVTLSGMAPADKTPLGSLTPIATRLALRSALKHPFHAVVANPPYVKERDDVRLAYQRERAGNRPRYLSATGKYSLGGPFTERLLQLALQGGFVGEITADSFMKREFGKSLVEKVLARHDLTKVLVLGGVAIPGNNTPSVMLFMRRQRPVSSTVRLVVCKRGERPAPANPALGRAWQSILRGHRQLDFENEFVVVRDVARSTLATHEWNVGGDEVDALKIAMEATGAPLSSVTSSIGVDTITHAGALIERSKDDYFRAAVSEAALAKFTEGDAIRNWAISTQTVVAVSYERPGWQLVEPSRFPGLARFLWPHRSWLARRWVSGGTRMCDVGKPFWAIPQLPREKHRTTLTIGYGEVATHNHFALSLEDRVYEQAAPIIKLADETSVERHLSILAQLNSSAGEFWMKRVYQPKGGDDAGDGARTAGEPWEERYQRSGTKLSRFPLAKLDDDALTQFARHLDALARARVDDSPGATLDATAGSGARALRVALDTRRERDRSRIMHMVALQEELDWLCYRLYGIDSDAEIRDPTSIPPLTPGLRPFEIALARDDAERRAAIARGEEPDEQPTAWFVRHGWTPHTTLDALPESERAVVQARLDRTEASRELSLLEQPTYKRRWYKPDYEKEEREALTLWLQDRIEDWAKTRKEPFTIAQAAAALRSDPAVLAVGELLTGRADFDVDALVGEQIVDQAVPSQKHHVFKPEGLRKRAQWEETWRLQHLEDAGEKVTPPVPPKYDSKDYLRAEYWSLRGKLDVPKERFIAFTEVPASVSDAPLYGWAGWTHRERAKVLLALDEKAEGARIAVKERYGLLHGAWFLLPYVAWEDPKAAADMRADVKGVVGEQGVTEAMLEEWAAAHPPPARGRTAKPPTTTKIPKKRAPKAKREEDETEAS